MLRLLLALASLCLVNGQVGEEIGCYQQGECINSPFVQRLTADSPDECLRACQDYQDDDSQCEYFTHYWDTDVGFQAYNKSQTNMYLPYLI